MLVSQRMLSSRTSNVGVYGVRPVLPERVFHGLNNFLRLFLIPGPAFFPFEVELDLMALRKFVITGFGPSGMRIVSRFEGRV